MTDVPLLPPSLPVVETLTGNRDGECWLRQLPGLIDTLASRWQLRTSAPLHGGSCSWVAPTLRADGTPAVLKLTWPHPEAVGEAAALRHWTTGLTNPAAVRPYAWDDAHYALLLERCEPGTTLLSHAELTDVERLTIGLELLTELWAAPSEGTELPAEAAELTTVCAQWADLVEERYERYAAGLGTAADPGLVRQGAELLRDLPASAKRRVLLHGDFNPGNVLAAARRPWLVIDPKPMVGDPGYDPWPLVQQLPGELPLPRRLSLTEELTGERADRLAAWALARTVEYALWSADGGNVEEATGALTRARALADLAGGLSGTGRGTRRSAVCGCRSGHSDGPWEAPQQSGAAFWR